MPTENLLKPDMLRRLAWTPPALTTDAVASALAGLGARPWQIDQTAQKIVDAFVEAAQSPDPTVAPAS